MREFQMPLGIHPVKPRADHRNRGGSTVQRPFVGRSIDTQRQP